jgi:peptidoglycan hydrolase-like protein with peptidoglycan-binding domain
MKFGMTTIASLGLVAGVGLLTLTTANAAAPSAATSGTNIAAAQPANPDNMANTNMANTNMANTNMANTGMANTSMTSQNPGKMSRQTVRHVQEFLAGDGHKVAIDGVWGPATEAALKSYQKQDGLTVTGQLDQSTRSQMKLQG